MWRSDAGRSARGSAGPAQPLLIYSAAGAPGVFFGPASGWPVMRAASSRAVLHQLAARFHVVARGQQEVLQVEHLLPLARPLAAELPGLQEAAVVLLDELLGDRLERLVDGSGLASLSTPVTRLPQSVRTLVMNVTASFLQVSART